MDLDRLWFQPIDQRLEHTHVHTKTTEKGELLFWATLSSIFPFPDSYPKTQSAWAQYYKSPGYCWQLKEHYPEVQTDLYWLLEYKNCPGNTPVAIQKYAFCNMQRCPWWKARVWLPKVNNANFSDKGNVTRPAPDCLPFPFQFGFQRTTTVEPSVWARRDGWSSLESSNPLSSNRAGVSELLSTCQTTLAGSHCQPPKLVWPTGQKTKHCWNELAECQKEERTRDITKQRRDNNTHRGVNQGYGDKRK